MPQLQTSFGRGDAKLGTARGSSTPDPGVKFCSDLSTRGPSPPPLPTPRFHFLLQGPAPTSSIPEVPARGQPRPTPARWAYGAVDYRARGGRGTLALLPAKTREHVGSPDKWKDRQTRMGERGKERKSKEWEARRRRKGETQVPRQHISGRAPPGPREAGLGRKRDQDLSLQPGGWGASPCTFPT